MDKDLNQCLSCKRTSKEVPLIQMEYQGNTIWICPQHLPVLIHKPEQLAGLLPGAERFGSHEHQD